MIDAFKSDIVWRLRNTDDILCEEAADEIERLHDQRRKCEELRRRDIDCLSADIERLRERCEGYQGQVKWVTDLRRIADALEVLALPPPSEIK